MKPFVMKMGNMKSLMGMLVLMLMMKVGLAVDYTVGGQNGGWDQSTDLGSWASQFSFHPGDNLIFEYTPNHNVIEVSAADFNSCITTNPLRPPFSGGRSVVPLTATGSRFFICSTSGHCPSGMKLKVNVVPSATTPSPPAEQSPSPSQSPPPLRSDFPPPPKSSKTASGSKQNKAGASSPALAPATAPPPGGFLSPPPSSATKFNGMGALAAAATGFLIMVVCIF